MNPLIFFETHVNFYKLFTRRFNQSYDDGDDFSNEKQIDGIKTGFTSFGDIFHLMPQFIHIPFHSISHLGFF